MCKNISFEIEIECLDFVDYDAKPSTYFWGNNFVSILFFILVSTAVIYDKSIKAIKVKVPQSDEEFFLHPATVRRNDRSAQSVVCGDFFFLKKTVWLHICRDVIYWHLTPRPSAINLILPKLNCGLGLADKHNVFSKNVIDSISYAFSFLGNGREPTDFSLGNKTYTLPYGAFLCWHLFPRL